METFLNNYFPQIGIILTGFFGFYAYLHYELCYNGRDLIFWKKLLCQCLIEVGRYKYAYTFILFLAILNVIIICIALTCRPNVNSWLEEEEHENQIKERYRNFIFIRLLNAVDKIEAKYINGEEPGKHIAFENLVRAHDEIWSAIMEFRKDAHKLYKLNETEVWMPLEDVFCLVEDEEKEIMRTSYYREKVTIDYDKLASLLYG